MQVRCALRPVRQSVEATPGTIVKLRGDELPPCVGQYGVGFCVA